MIFSYDYNGQTHTLQLERLGDDQYRATIAERVYTFSASQFASLGWLIRHKQHQTTAYAIAKGTERAVHVDGQHYALTVTEVTQKRKRAQAGADLSAQMPGQITDVRVQDGESVLKGHVLLIMEAMKMEIRVSAPHDGVIKRVLIQKGQVVERGQTLVEMGE